MLSKEEKQVFYKRFFIKDLFIKKKDKAKDFLAL